jgi:hypothetical protein
MQNDFSYNSSHWERKDVYAVEDGLEGLTEKQTKLASYWNTPFTKLCLGMKVNNVTNWIAVDHQASSLFSQIADGGFRATSAGRVQWRSLIDGSSLQKKCNKEGFNFRREVNENFMKIRIGLVANQEDYCSSPDSCIGFGISIRTNCQPEAVSTTCGNVVICDEYHDVDERDTAAFGFILVQ